MATNPLIGVHDNADWQGIKSVWLTVSSYFQAILIRPFAGNEICSRLARTIPPVFGWRGKGQRIHYDGCEPTDGPKAGW